MGCITPSISVGLINSLEEKKHLLEMRRREVGNYSNSSVRQQVTSKQQLNGHTTYYYFGHECRLVSLPGTHHAKTGNIPDDSVGILYNNGQYSRAKINCLYINKVENERSIKIKRIDCRVKQGLRRKARPVKTEEGKAKCKRSDNRN